MVYTVHLRLQSSVLYNPGDALLSQVDASKYGTHATPCNLSRHQDHDPQVGGIMICYICTDSNSC